MSKYIITGTNISTGKREMVGTTVYDSKKEAEKFVDTITLSHWTRIPKGITKQQVKQIYRPAGYKNIRIKQVI